MVCPRCHSPHLRKSKSATRGWCFPCLCSWSGCGAITVERSFFASACFPASRFPPLPSSGTWRPERRTEWHVPERSEGRAASIATPITSFRACHPIAGFVFRGSLVAQPCHQPLHLPFQSRQSHVRRDVVQVVNVPVFDLLCPGGKLLGQHGPMLAFFHGDDELRGPQIGGGELPGRPQVAGDRNAQGVQSFQRVGRDGANIAGQTDLQAAGIGPPRQPSAAQPAS